MVPIDTIPIYCITLEREKERRYHKVIEMFRANNLEVLTFPAIDGNEFNSSEDIMDLYNIPAKNLNKNAIATALSHRSVWKRIVELKIERAIIVEDDVWIGEDFSINLQKILAEIYKNEIGFDIVLLGYSFNPTMDYQKESISENLYRLKCFNGFFCYMVSRKGAQKMLSMSENLENQLDLQISKNSNNMTILCPRNQIASFFITPTQIHFHKLVTLESWGITFHREAVRISGYFNGYVGFWNYIVTNYTLICLVIGLVGGYARILFLLSNLLDLFLVGVNLEDFDLHLPSRIGTDPYDSAEITNKAIDLGILIISSVFMGHI